MPNIIEQQDLLKGLPDARLATLLQNPVADIPPFLVAAEAQRRQAIRQQFAGAGSKESVVDSLTKQLANVPQNIGEKSTPTESADLKGILDKNAEIKDAISSQQEEDQKSMASGGIVRRYAAGGIASISPKGTMYGFTPGVQMEQALGNVARASSVIPQTMGAMPGYLGYQARPQQPQQMRRGGMVQRYGDGGLAGKFYEPAPGSAVERMARTYMFLNPGMTYEEALQRAGIGAELPRPSVGELAASAAGRMSSEMGGIGDYSVLRRASEKPDQPAISEKSGGVEPPDSAPKSANGMPIAGSSAGMSFTPKIPEQVKIDPEEAKPKEGETPDEFRARLAELVKAQEPSNFDKAQRWFSAAEQFLDPSKTTMQSIAGAGRAFTEVSAELEREKRNAQLAEQKALLEYDIAEKDAKTSAERDARAAQVESIKYQSEQALREAELYRKAADDAAAALKEYEKNSMFSSPEQSANDPVLVGLRERVRTANEEMRNAISRSKLYQQKYGQLLGTYSKSGYWAGGDEIVR